jgi:diguanylate cyclase (GGDEF)-like protein/PAS domain S-box-containing protein
MNLPVGKEQIAFDLLENIQASFALYEVITENNKIIDLRMLWANQQYLDVVKLTLEEAVGMLFSQIAPHDISWIPFYGEIGLREKDTQIVESYSKEAMQFIHVQAYSPAPGQVATVLHVRNRFVESEYEKDKEEQRIRAILGYIPEGLLFGELIYNKIGEEPADIHCLYVNQAFEIYEDLVVNTLAGKNLYAIYPDKSKEGLIKCHKAVKDNEELHYLKHDRHNRIIEVDIYPNGYNQVFIIQRDITARKKTEEELNSTKKDNLIKSALNQMAATFLSPGNETFDDIMSKGIKAIADVLDLDRVAVYRLVRDKLPLIKQAYLWHGKTLPLEDDRGVVPKLSSTDPLINTLLKGGCINADVSKLSGDLADFLKKFGCKAIYFVPIFTYGKFWGVITLEDYTNYRYFNDEDLELLNSTANLCASAVMRHEIEQEAMIHKEFKETMFSTAPIGLVVFDEQYQIIDCNDIVPEILGVTKEYYLNNLSKMEPEYQNDGSKSSDKRREYMRRALDGEKIKTEWTHCSSKGEPIPTELTLTRIKQGDQYIGFAYFYDLREIKTLQEKAEEVYYDSLTRIHNRRYLDEVLNSLIKSLSRNDSTLSLLMIDIDRFKLYNDTYGHIEGDNCLKKIAEILTQSITRETDFIARYGGEEFVVVLPHTDEDGARKVAEKILDNIRKAKISHSKSDVAGFVTVSIGVTTGKVNYFQNSSDYIKKADEMLYISKQGGRNKYTYNYL